MAGSINEVNILGRLGADPEVRNFQNGGQVCNLRVATSDSWRDKQTGERRERTEWHSVAIFSEPLVRIASQYLRKGSQVMVKGRLETRKWQDANGQDRYSTEVVLRPYRGELVLLGRPGEGGGDGGRRQDASSGRPRPEDRSGPRRGDHGADAYRSPDRSTRSGALSHFTGLDGGDEIPF